MSDTKLQVVCAGCGADMGEIDGEGQEGVSHGMCDKCWEKFDRENPEPCPEHPQSKTKATEAPKRRKAKAT